MKVYVPCRLVLVLAVSFFVHSVNAQTPTITATLKDSLSNDVNNNQMPNEGDGLRYKTVIKNSGTGNATGVNLSQPAPTNTTLVTGSVKTSPLARVDSFSTAYNTALNTGAATVLSNDFGMPAPTVKSFGPTATPATVANGTNSAATNNGGTVTMNANGTFTYTPATNFAGYDRFAYIGSNGNAPDNDAVVVIAVGAAPAPSPDTYSAIGNMFINQNVLSNDNGTAITVTAVNGSASNVGTSFNTPSGATVTLTSSGALTYSPPPGFEGADAFNYTVNNAFNSPVTVNVTVNIAGMIWFIDTSYNGSVKDGRLSTPFRSTKAFQAVNNGIGNNPASGDNIFIYENGLDYDGSIILLNKQKLIGQDATSTLEVITGLVPPMGSAALPVTNPGNTIYTNLITTSPASPVITLTSIGAGVGNGNTLAGFKIGNKTGAGIVGTAFATLTVLDVLINGTGQVMSLNNGAVSAQFDSLACSSSAGQGIHLESISGSLTSLRGTSVAGTTTQGILIANSTANMSFGNTIISSASDGLSLQNNSAGTRTFGILNITTTGSGAINGILHSINGGTLVAGATTVTNQAGTGSAVFIDNSASNITLGATTVNKIGAAAGVVINALAAAATVTFTSLEVTTSNGAGLVGTENLGQVIVTNNGGSINATGGAAIALSKGSGTSTVNLQFTNISSTSGSAGINLTNIDGSITAAGGSISEPTGSGIDISGGSVSLAYGGSVTKNTAGSVVRIINHVTGTVTLSGALNASTLNAGNGIQLDNADGTYNFSGVITFIQGDAGIDILNGSTGNINFSNTGSLIQDPTGHSFNVVGATGIVTYAGLMLKGFGVTGAMVNVSAHPSGTLNFPNTIQRTGGTAFQFSDADGVYNFSGSVTMSSTDVTIDIVNGSAGTFTFGNGVGIDAPVGTAFNVSGGSANITYNGTIQKNNLGSIVSISGGHNGAITFQTGTLSATTSAAGNGLQFDNADGTYNFFGTTTLNGGDAGIDILNGSGGTFNFATTSGSIAITNPTGNAFNLGGTSNAATINYDGNITKNNAGSLISIGNHASGMITFVAGNTLSAAAGNGLQFDNADGIYNFNGTTTLNGGDAGIDILNGSAGTFNFAATSSITNPTGEVIKINASSANFNYPGTFSKTNATSLPGINITGATGGTININGTGTKTLSTAAQPAINFTSNAGATINFAGNNLLLTTTSGTAVNATGGGLINISGTGNIITTATGTAVNVISPTNIGSGVTFQSVTVNNGASTSAVNGIVLNGTTGPFTVTGDGSQTGGYLDRDASGGTINRTSGHSVSLINASNVTLRQMNITNTAVGGACPAGCTSNAINSSGGSNIVVSAVLLQNLGGNGWAASNITGVNRIDNNSMISTWNTNNTNGVTVANTSTNFSGSFTVDKCLFTTSATGADGFLFDVDAGSTGTVTVTNSEFTLIDQDAVQINNDGPGTLTAIVQRNNFHDADATGGDGNNTLFLALAGGGTLNFTIGGPTAADGNTFTNLARLSANAGILQVNAAGGAAGSSAGAKLNGTIQNNTISNPGITSQRRGIMIGIEPSAGNHGGHTVLIANNSVQGLTLHGIYASIVTVGGFDCLNNNISIKNNSVGTTAAVGTAGGDSGSAIEFETNVDAPNVGSDISANLLFQGNVAVANNTSGIGDVLEITNRNTGGNNTSTLNVTVLGNTFTQQNASGQVFEIRNSLNPGTTICLDLNADNNSANRNTATGGNGTGFRLTNDAGVYNIEGMAAGPQTGAAVQAFLAARNTGAVSPSNDGATFPSGSFVGAPAGCANSSARQMNKNINED
jgi:hypothetical protein